MLVKIDIDFGGVNFPAPYRKPNTLYIGFVSVFAGCKRALAGKPCPDCQNPSLWSGLAWNGDKHAWIADFVRKKCELLKGIDAELFYCILGGEPLDQDERELKIVHRHVIQGCGRKLPTVLYTGYSSIPPQVAGYVKAEIQYLKIGEYLGDAQREEGLPSGLATRNQKWVRL